MSWRDFLAHLRPREAHAHCDIPCGIYDPLPAQIAAMTVLRMHQLIEGLQKPGPDASKEELDRYENSLSRYVAAATSARPLASSARWSRSTSRTAPR